MINNLLTYQPKVIYLDRDAMVTKGNKQRRHTCIARMFLKNRKLLPQVGITIRFMLTKSL